MNDPFSVSPDYEEKYGVSVPLEVLSTDKPDAVRKLLKFSMLGVAEAVMRQWLKDPRSYNVDVHVELTPRDKLPIKTYTEEDLKQ